MKNDIFTYNKAKETIKIQNINRVFFEDDLMLGYNDFNLVGILEKDLTKNIGKNKNQEYFLTYGFNKKALDFLTSRGFGNIIHLFQKNITLSKYEEIRKDLFDLVNKIDLTNFGFNKYKDVLDLNVDLNDLEISLTKDLLFQNEMKSINIPGVIYVEMEEVDNSSTIKEIGYDESEELLRIVFKNQSKKEFKPNGYYFFGFPKYLWEQFKDSFSKGEFFSTHIKGRFQDLTKSSNGKFVMNYEIFESLLNNDEVYQNPQEILKELLTKYQIPSDYYDILKIALV